MSNRIVKLSGSDALFAAADPVHAGDSASMQSTPGFYSTRIVAAALATALLLASPLALAKETPADAGQLSEWKPLGGGFVGRRRLPPKANLPVSQRRHATTQPRDAVAKTRRAKEGASSVATGSSTELAATADALDIDAVWIRTVGAGLYGVTIADLAAQFGESLNSVRKNASHGKLSLTNAGAPVSWYYDASTEMVLFAAEAYDTFYSGENAYRISLSNKEALPMQVVEDAPTGAIGSEMPFMDTLTFEEEPDMQFATWAVASEPDADYWFWDYLYGGYLDRVDVALNIPHPAAVGGAQLRVTLRGWTNLEQGDEHHVYALLNGEELDPVDGHMLDGHNVVSWDGFEERLLVADISQGLLDPDGNNTLELHNVYTAGTHPGQFLDAIEIDYSRLPAAVDGELWMHDATVGAQTVTGFAGNDILVIESPSGAAVLRTDVLIEADGAGGWSVTFEAAAGADYLVAERGAVKSPTLAPAEASSLTKENNRADYLIVAPRDFQETAEMLAELRSSRFAFVKIVWLDEIYNAFSAGRTDPSAITRFIKYVQESWQVTPSNVMLIGKGTIDEKDRMGYADSFLPVLMTSTPWSLTASDDRLLDVGIDAPFAIGRLPVTRDDEGIAYVNKLIAYESTTPGGERFEAVLVADNPDAAGDFHANSDELARRLLDTMGFDEVTKLYHPDDAVRASLTESATWETGYVSYDGHGTSAQVGDGREKFITAADANGLENSAHPVFTALTCAAGNYSYPGTRSLASALVLNPNGGAIASLAPTGLSLDADAQLLGISFVESLFVENNTIGDALREAKLQTSGVISEFMPGIYSVVGDPGVYAR